MKNFKTKIATIAVLVFGYSTSRAADGGLFVEPSITYEASSTAKVDWPSPLSSSAGSVLGLGIGARLGVHLADIFFVGADARYSQPKFKDSDNSFEADSASLNYGVVAGLQTPVAGLRVWGGYVLGGEIDPKEDNGFNFKFKEATGYRVGAGLYVAVVSVNLEYQSLKYNTAELQDAGAFTGNLDNTTMTNDAYVLSVSFPIAL